MPLQKLSHPIIANVVRFFFISIRPSSLKRTPEECVHQNMTRLANASRICDLDSDSSNGFKINNLYPRPRNIYSIELLFLVEAFVIRIDLKEKLIGAIYNK